MDFLQSLNEPHSPRKSQPPETAHATVGQLASVSVFDSIQIESHLHSTFYVVRIIICIMSIHSISYRDLEMLN